MTITFVQSASDGGGGISSSTRPVTVSAIGTGNFVFGIVTWGSATSGDLSSVTDNAGGSPNTYTILMAVTDATNGQSIGLFYGYNITGGPTVITANFGSSLTYTGISVEEFSGLGTSDPLDGTNYQSQLQASPGTGTDGAQSGASTKTPSVDGCLIAGGSVNTGAVNNTGLSEFAAGTSFTEPSNAEYISSGSEISLSSEYWIQTTATAANASFTVAQNTAHYTFMAIFKPDGGGGVIPTASGMQNIGEGFCASAAAGGIPQGLHTIDQGIGA
jgi:hypothetical protein